MKVLLRGVHLDLTDALRDYVEEHLVSHLGRYIEDEATELDIALVDINGPKGGVDQECRVTVRMPGLAAVHVTETAETLFQAIDGVRDRLENTLKRTLEKRRERGGEGLPMDVRF
jgi:ribosomal subunit interface protein